MTETLKRKQQDSDFTDAYKNFYPFIFKFCCARLSGDTALAEDCVQETFYVYYCKIDAGQEILNPKAFLTKTANLITLHHRTRRVSREANTADIEDYEDYLVDPKETWRLAEDNDLKRFISERLSEKEYELFRLRYIEERSVREAAERLSVSVTAVTTALSRLRKKLQNILKEYGVMF